MKNTIGTTFLALIFLSSAVLAQEKIETPLTSQVASSTGISTYESLVRVSIIGYGNVLKTINAYNVNQKYQIVVPGVTRVKPLLVGQPSYQELIVSTLWDWYILRKDRSVQQRTVNVFAGMTTPITDSNWRRQEFLNEFNRDSFVFGQNFTQILAIR